MNAKVISVVLFGALALCGCAQDTVSISADSVTADTTKKAADKKDVVNKGAAKTKEPVKKDAAKKDKGRLTDVKLLNDVLSSPCANAEEGTELRIDCCYEVAEMCNPDGEGGTINDQLKTTCESNSKKNVQKFWKTKNAYCKGHIF